MDKLVPKSESPITCFTNIIFSFQEQLSLFYIPIKQGGKLFWTDQKVCLRFRSKPIRLHKFAIA